jgi:molecular chaperone HscB
MSRDAFDVLGLPAQFDLTPATLQAAYLALSALLHPDAAGVSAADPDIEARAAELNAAKRTLENPESRADLLLRRLGGPTKEQDKSLPPTFLAEMLETREEIDAAVASKDAEAIERWQDWATDRRQGHIAATKGMFAAAATVTVAQQASVLKNIRAELNMWRYVERLIEQLDGVS